MTLNLDRSSWQRVKFGAVVTKVTDTGLPTSSESLLYVGLENMPTDGSVTIRSWGSKVDIVVPKTRVRAGDVLFARRNTALRRVAIAPHDGYFSPDGYALRAIEGRLSHEFLPWVVASDAFMDHAVRHSAGTHSKRVKWSDLATYDFELPPLDQQRRIAKLLWALELHLESVSHTLGLAGETVQCFTEERLSELARRNGTCELERLADITSGITLGPSRAKFPNRSPYLRVANVARGHLNLDELKEVNVKEEELSSKALDPGDVLVVEGHASATEVGRAALWTGEAGMLFQNHLFRVRAKANVKGKYLEIALNATEARQYLRSVAKSTSGLSTINGTVLKKTPIARATPAEQEQLVRQVEEAASCMAKLGVELAHVQELRSKCVNEFLAGGS